MPTSVRTPAELAEAGFVALASHDLSRPEEIWGKDAVDHFLALGSYRGRDAIADFFRELFASFPDLEIAVERIIPGGEDLVVVQWRMRGTFSGAPFQGVQASGRDLDLRGCDVVDLCDEVVKENTIYFDGASFARQIGVLPPEGSLPDRAAVVLANARTRMRRLIGRLHRAAP